MERKETATSILRVVTPPLHTAGRRVVVMTKQGNMGTATETFEGAAAGKKCRPLGSAQKVGVPMATTGVKGM